MNQIIEKLYYEKEKLSISKELSKIKKGIENDYKDLDLIEKVKTILIAFAKRNTSKTENDKHKLRRFETEIIGSLVAYIESIDKKIKIDVEPQFKTEHRKLNPDIVLEQDKEKVLIELKISRRESAFMMNRQIFEDQLLSYLIHTNINKGILLVIPDEMNENDEYDVESKKIEVGQNKIEILKIHLKWKKKEVRPNILEDDNVS